MWLEIAVASVWGPGVTEDKSPVLTKKDVLYHLQGPRVLCDDWISGRGAGGWLMEPVTLRVMVQAECAG